MQADVRAYPFVVYFGRPDLVSSALSDGLFEHEMGMVRITVAVVEREPFVAEGGQG